jgi:hypothetical protein
MSAVQTGMLWRVASAQMPTKWGMFDAIGFERDVSKGTRGVETALALVMSLRHHDNDGSFASDVFPWRRSDHNRTVEVALEI